MELKIGIQNIGRELTLETDETAEQIAEKVAAALAKAELLSLSDTKGRVVLIPADQIGYVDCGQANSRPVGFGSV